MVRSETIQHVTSATAVLVELPPALEEMCLEVLLDSGLRVLKVKHAAAAAERIPAIIPHVVFMMSTLHPDHVATLTSRCMVVGAELVSLPADGDAAVIAKKVRDAAAAAINHAGRRGS